VALRSAPNTRRGRRGERGASLIEFAIVLPILCLFLFGIIDGGSVYSNYISVRQGVREGARLGVVMGSSPVSTCAALGITLNTTDITPSTDIQNLMCATKSRIGITPSSVYVKVLFDPTYAANNGLIVCAMTRATSISGALSPFISSGSYLKSKVEMDIESATAGETAGEETAPASAPAWSNWCTTTSSTP